MRTPSSLGDLVGIGQIIRNLAFNALRYGGKHRVVHVGTDGANGVVEFRDNGPAIPLEDRDRISNPTPGHRTGRAWQHRSVSGFRSHAKLVRLMGGDVLYLRDGDENVFRLTLLPAGHAIERDEILAIF